MANRTPPWIERVARVDLFRTCNRTELDKIVALTTELDVAAGRVLCHEGRPTHGLVGVVDGVAAVTIGGELVATIGPGGFFGELAPLDGATHSATVTAATSMRLLVLSRGEVAALLLDVPTVSPRIQESTAGTPDVRARRPNPDRVNA